jgi:hypothetical protein
MLQCGKRGSKSGRWLVEVPSHDLSPDISTRLSQANRSCSLVSAACAAQARTDGDSYHPVNGHEGAKTNGKNIEVIWI